MLIIYKSSVLSVHKRTSYYSSVHKFRSTKMNLKLRTLNIARYHVTYIDENELWGILNIAPFSRVHTAHASSLFEFG